MPMPGKLEFADGLRGVACSTVVATHLFSLFWNAPELAAQFANTTPPPAGIQLPAVAAVIRAVPHVDPGAFGVALFFLISGFVIPISLDRYSVLAFLVGRFWRIVPTYVACFSITVGAIALAGLHYGRPFPFSTAEVGLHAVPGPRFVTGSRFIDLVTWTLEVEVLFYVICAVCAPALRHRSAWFMLIPVSVCVAFAYGRLLHDWPIFSHYAPHLVFMFAGVAISAYHLGKISLATAAASVAGCLVLAGISLRHSGNPAVGLVATSSLAALALFLVMYRLRRHIRSAGALPFLARISYPLYVVHAIAGYAIMRVLLDWKLSPDIVTLAAAAAVMCVAALVHRAVERPTQALGQSTARAITKRAATKTQKSSGRIGTRVPWAAAGALGSRIRRQLASARTDSRELS